MQHRSAALSCTESINIKNVKNELFRNQKTESFEKLHTICYNKKVILVSATPQNNYSSDIANQIDCLNFRSFIFACQKTTDILRLYNKEIDRLFVKQLFMSVVAFSFRLKNDDTLYWDDKKNGGALGTSKYPLFRFAHDYIRFQHFDAAEMEKEEEL